MELDKLIKQDIAEFLRLQQEKDISVKGVRDDELSLFDFDRDYAKELSDQIKTHNLVSAKDVFDSVRGCYNRTSQNDPKKKKIYTILTELYGLLLAYISEKGIRNTLSMELKHYEDRKSFGQDQLPDRILSALEDEALKRSPEKKTVKEPETTIFSRDVGAQIAKDIPLEESNELSKLFGGTVIIQQTSPPSIVQVSQPAALASYDSKPAGTAPLSIQQGPQPIQASQQGYSMPPSVVMQVPSQQVAPGVTKEMLKDMVETITEQIMKNTQKQPGDMKKQVEIEAEHDFLLEQKKRELREKQIADQQKLIQESIEKLSKRREQLAKEKSVEQHKPLPVEIPKPLKMPGQPAVIPKKALSAEQDTAMLDSIMAGMKSINIRLGENNIKGAKAEYRKLRENFMKFPVSAEKKQLYKDILGLYDQIRFIEREPIGKNIADIHTELRDILLNVKKEVLKGELPEAKKLLKTAKAKAESIRNPGLSKYASGVIEQYSQRITLAIHPESKAAFHEHTQIEKNPESKNRLANLYLKGVFLLYNNRKQEAGLIFKQVLELDPDNKAAQIRLKEAA